jgi:spore coat protein U-like protein
VNAKTTIGLPAALAIALFGAATAQAAGTSGTIRLQGTVQAVCTVSVTDAGAQLDISGGENAKTVGTVTETCNSGSGYRVTVASANGGSLKSGNNAVAYQLKYDTQSGSLTGPMTVERSSAAFGKQSVVAVSMSANASAVAGAYSDTLTITVASR